MRKFRSKKTIFVFSLHLKHEEPFIVMKPQGFDRAHVVAGSFPRGINIVLTMKRKLALSSLPFIFLTFSLCAFAESSLRFNQISTKNGLSQNTVRTILVDKKGFIWAGTLDGLNRYDGYRIVSFKPQAGNPNSLNDHRIKDVFQDKQGYLWIKTYNNEFSCYNPQEESFIHYLGNKRNFYSKNYFESRLGDIWLWGENNKCMRIRKNAGAFSSKVFVTNATKGARDYNNFLFEDSHRNLWIGKDKGLCLVRGDGAVEYFSGKYTFTKAVEVGGKVYFTTQQSVLVEYNLRNAKFSEKKLPVSVLKNAIVASSNQIFLVETNGVCSYNLLSGKITKSPWQLDSELTGEIDFIQDQQQGIWFYNHTGNVWYCNPATGQTKKMRLIPTETVRLIDLERYNFLMDKKGIYWITTYGNGLFSYDPKTDNLVNYKYQSDKNSLPSDYLLSIAQDNYGNLWIGSEFGGIIKATTPRYAVNFIRPEDNNSYGRNNNVRSLCTSSHNEIWVGTKKGSLYVYDYALQNLKSVKDNITPYTFREDQSGRIWVGTKGNGLYLFDVKTKKELGHYNNDPASVSEGNLLKYNTVYSILRDSKHRMWLAFFSGGVALANEGNGKLSFKYFFEGQGNRSYVRCLFQDRQGIIWAGTSDGIVKFDPDKLLRNAKEFKTYRLNLKDKSGLNCNDVKTIFQDKSGQIWIGTAGGGLSLYVAAAANKPEHFEAFTTEEGLSGNIVSGIMEDEEGNLWVSTENGINRFNKKTRAVVNYFFSEKTYGNHFNENVNVKKKDGEMVWGSLDGIIEFDPKSFVPDQNTPPVTLTNFLVNGQSLAVNEENSVLDKAISYTRKMELNYKQNTFTIEFSTLSLSDPERNSYSYILENYDLQWSPIGKANFATYKNLEPGTYLFKVKGTNSDGIWNGKYTELEIVITPPVWKSTTAYVIYLILILSGIYFAFRLVWKFNKLNNDIQLEKKLTNHKLRFFTNISHEFRTPLTLIRGAVENLNDMEDVPKVVQKQINVLSRNSDNLSRLIDQLLEFRKLQNQVLTLDLSETDIVAFGKEIFGGFLEMASQKEITYRFRSNLESYTMFIDRRKVDKIFYNLLSNAFKFTPKKGAIEFCITIEQADKLLSVEVKDTGVGIPKEKQLMLFSRFMQINFSSSGTGVGLSLCKDFVDAHKGRIWYESNPEGGSVFHVNLSTDVSIYPDAKFVSADTDVVSPTPIFADTDFIPEENSEVKLPDIDDGIISNFKMLIIDDNDDIRNFLQEEFSKYFMVYVAEDGKIGLEKAMEYNPNLIICDVMMPEMDGFEVTRQLKQNFETCHIPIVLLTAHSSTEHQLEGFESGADAYVTKPFSLKILKAQVFKMIQHREQLKKRFSNEYVLDGNLITYNDKDKTFYDLIEKILENNYTDSQFSVDRFAELANVRRTIFYKKLKGITGLSPNELIKMKRLKKAAEMLLVGDLTVSEISYKVGFEDPFYFSKCFKAQFNCSPSKYGDKPAEERD